VRNVDPSGHCFGVLGGIDILICAGVVVFVAGTIAAVAASPSSGFNWNDYNWSDWSLPGSMAETNNNAGEESADTSKEPLSVEEYLKGTTQVSSGKSKQHVKTGDLNDANNDFDRLAAGRNVQDDGEGKRSVKLADGTRIGVRPTSSEGNPATAALPTQAGGSPTIQIDPPKGQGRPIKTRYIP